MATLQNSPAPQNVSYLKNSRSHGLIILLPNFIHDGNIDVRFLAKLVVKEERGCPFWREAVFDYC